MPRSALLVLAALGGSFGAVAAGMTFHPPTVVGSGSKSTRNRPFFV
jgi:hypothetical protein